MRSLSSLSKRTGHVGCEPLEQAALRVLQPNLLERDLGVGDGIEGAELKEAGGLWPLDAAGQAREGR